MLESKESKVGRLSWKLVKESKDGRLEGWKTDRSRSDKKSQENQENERLALHTSQKSLISLTDLHSSTVAENT